MPTRVDEVAPDVFRISTYIPEYDLQFSQFLVRDDEPLLYHTGMGALFPAVREAVATLIDPADLRWISFSHFESDESGAMNHWLQAAPHAQVACGFICAVINVNDSALRPPRALQDNEVFSTGRRRFRYRHTPQLPHGWDAGMLYEETTRSLFCSDLLHQVGDREPICESGDVVERFHAALTQYDAGPFASYLPYTRRTRQQLESLAQLEPRTLLPMHGSIFHGNGASVLRRLDAVLQR